MSSKFGQIAATSQFFLYGKKHFTRTGWERHSKYYEKPDIMEQGVDLSKKVFIVTGANAGVGREVTQFLAKNKATIFMLCRNRGRAEAAKAQIEADTGNRNLHILEGDVGVEADVRRCWQAFLAHSASQSRLDALVCNAGALLKEKTLTKEGVEVTIASHFIYGTYLLGSLAMPTLQATPDSRFIVVSSGGMYNFAFPSWEVATWTSNDRGIEYDGTTAYAYAKRGQVLLCERWAAKYPSVKVVSCHPGWTGTDGVDLAFGDQKKYLEPLRTQWQGAEGIAWLCVCPASKIQSGEFYLDRRPQVKHLAGPFFTEGSYTKNTPEQVDAMLKGLEDWTSGRKPEDLAAQAKAFQDSVEASKSPLAPMARKLDIERFMGKWYVVANIPTPFDKGTINNTEDYRWDASTKTIYVVFSYSNTELTKTSRLKQRATIKNEGNTEWKIAPKIGIYVPLPVPYIVADCAEDYSYSIIGIPDRSYVWVMTRTPSPGQAVVDDLIRKVRALGYDESKVVQVPQIWDRDCPVLSEAEDEAMGA
mmetsp:Transcript_93/g.249  ORF Transcript_93/g.249 Transcript_93/m.249 type:complete len:532 (-) Transcript_93:399-1994(-)